MKTLNEEIERIKKVMGITKNKIPFNYHQHLIEIFSSDDSELGESEDINRDESKTDFLEKLNNNDFETDPELFFNSINKSKKHKEMLSDFSVEDFSGMKLFKVSGYDAGYALKKSSTGEYDEIVSVFNNSDVKGIGNYLIKSAINNGGCYLDHYDGYLSNFYENLGFEEYERYEFDPQYDPKGEFESKYGRQDVILRKHKSC